jgi:hypothetical protein
MSEILRPPTLNLNAENRRETLISYAAPLAHVGAW